MKNSIYRKRTRKGFDHRTARVEEMPLPMSFALFHERNPAICKILIKLAREKKRQGYKKISMAALVESARWDREGKRSSFSVPNGYRRLYAELIEANEPGLRGFFTTPHDKLAVGPRRAG